jgi:hypothetical protein
MRMKNFRRFWPVLMVLLFISSIGFAQVSVSPADMNKMSKEKLAELNLLNAKEKNGSGQLSSTNYSNTNAGAIKSTADLYGLKKMQRFTDPNFQYVPKPGANPTDLDYLLEDWASGDFATNGWTFDATQGNWSVYTSTGNPAPCARFYWSPQITTYSHALVSAVYNTSASSNLKLAYDIYLSNFSTVTVEALDVDVYDGSSWVTVMSYDNQAGDIIWASELLDVSAYSNANFQVRFRAYGADSYNINYWYIDNIHVYEPSTTPVVAVTPPSPFNFGNVQLGNSMDQVFTVTNSGGGSVGITGYAMDSPDFSIISSTTGTLPPDVVTVTVEFAPSSLGAKTTTLYIYDDLADATTTVTLNGTGVPVVPNDDCANAIPITGPFPANVTGTTVGAVADCFPEAEVYYSIDLPYAMNTVTIDYCPTPATLGHDINSLYPYYQATCDCGSYVQNTTNDFGTCTTGTAPYSTYTGIAGPTTIYIPVCISGDGGTTWDWDFSFDIDIVEEVPCVVDCPTGSIQENEPDIPDNGSDVTNGGCNAGTPVFLPIAIDDTYCGKVNTYLSGVNNFRDTDWYRIDLTGTNAIWDLTWTAEAEFPLLLFIIDSNGDDCGNLVFPTSGTADPCNILSISATGLEPDVYYLWIGPSVFTGLESASGPWDYYATLTGTSTPIYTVDGNLTYANGAMTPMDHAYVTLNDNTKAPLESTTTDDFGHFEFTVVPGDYNLTAVSLKPRGGTEVGDANMVINHILGSPLTGLQFLAADVTNDGVVDVSDLNGLVNDILGNPGWAAPDWFFENPSFTVSAASDLTEDFQGLCSGDPNGSYTPPYGAFYNDQFCDATEIIVDDPPIAGDNTLATGEAWEPFGSCWSGTADNTVWYSFVAPASGNVRISTDFVTGLDDTQTTLYEWTGGTCDNPTLVELGCGQDDGVTGNGWMAIINATGLTSGTTYYVQVDGYSTAVGDFEIEVTDLGSAAANDDFCNPTAIVVDDPPITDDNSTATVESWETGGSCWFGADPADHTLWYSFVAPSLGNVQISTDFTTGLNDTQMQLFEWTGGTCDNPTLSVVGCGEDEGSIEGLAAVITALGLTPGMTYYVQLDGYGGEAGDFMIEVTTLAEPPANDDCANAEAIGEVTDYAFSTTSASASGMIPSCGGTTAPNDIWYVYTASADGTLDIDLCGSLFDTRIAVWDGCAGAEIDCNDDNGPACTGAQSSVSIAVTNGSSYYIQVAGYNANVGDGDITTIFTPAK